jgi:hypothetical protein
MTKCKVHNCWAYVIKRVIDIGLEVIGWTCLAAFVLFIGSVIGVFVFDIFIHPFVKTHIELFGFQDYSQYLNWYEDHSFFPTGQIGLAILLVPIGLLAWLGYGVYRLYTWAERNS